MRPGLLVRALRLPFATASLLPYLFGTLYAAGEDGVRADLFLAGAGAVFLCHIGANLINDYADHLSGADWLDRRHYGFFGGSKLIQEGRLAPGVYRAGALAAGAGGLLATGAAALAGRPWAPLVFAPVFVLAWSYSQKPLQLSYRGLGELAVAALFGPATVGGAVYLQTGAAPGWAALLVSVPFGLLTAAILVANEVPDAATDRAAGKATLVTRLGRGRGYLLFAGLVLLAFAAVLGGVGGRLLPPAALLSLGALPLGVAATRRLRRHAAEKRSLLASSRLAIALHAAVSAVLIGGVAL
jgi:1,4-dihydroxy-2-naphthoate octaprenyltransferase